MAQNFSYPSVSRSCFMSSTRPNLSESFQSKGRQLAASSFVGPTPMSACVRAGVAEDYVCRHFAPPQHQLAIRHSHGEHLGPFRPRRQ